jgi:hypothetical protein
MLADAYHMTHDHPPPSHYRDRKTLAPQLAPIVTKNRVKSFWGGGKSALLGFSDAAKLAFPGFKSGSARIGAVWELEVAPC